MKRTMTSWILSVLLFGGLGLVLMGCGGGGQTRVSGASADAPSMDVTTLTATVFLSPTCGCCYAYVRHLRRQGLRVNVVEMASLSPKKQALGIPREMWSCHTTVIGDYIVEGHVPFEVVEKLLTEKPAIRGIALPGMPTGVPGMPGPKKQPLIIYALTDDQPVVYLEL